MGAVLLEQDHRQQAGADPAARDDVERRRRLGDRLAVAAGELLAHGLPHEPAARDDVEGLGDDLAHLGEPWPPQQRQVVGGGTTTRSRGRCAGNGRRAGLCRTWAATTVPAFAAAASAAASSSAAVSSSSASCSSSWSMSRLPRSLVCAELLAPGLGEQQLQALDLERGGGDHGLGLGAGRLRSARIIACAAARSAGQGCGLVRHGLMQAHSRLFLKSKDERTTDTRDQPASSGRQVRCGIRQSIPSSR